jgi:hypothetical protein
MSDNVTTGGPASSDEGIEEEQDIEPGNLIDPVELGDEDDLELPDEDGVLPVEAPEDPLASGFFEERTDPFLKDTEEEGW